MKPRIKDMLLRLAHENPGVQAKYKMAAGVVYNGHLVATGVNGYKTHPIMLNDGYKEEQVYLHAESDALVRATRLLTSDQLSRSELYVVRVTKGGREAMAKPCKGCFNLISNFGIKSVEWTCDS
jgi:deoxycytidylate deaminase